MSLFEPEEDVPSPPSSVNSPPPTTNKTHDVANQDRESYMEWIVVGVLGMYLTTENLPVDMAFSWIWLVLGALLFVIVIALVAPVLKEFQHQGFDGYSEMLHKFLQYLKVMVPLLIVIAVVYLLPTLTTFDVTVSALLYISAIMTLFFIARDHKIWSSPEHRGYPPLSTTTSSSSSSKPIRPKIHDLVMGAVSPI